MDNISKLYGNPINGKFWKGIRIVTHSRMMLMMKKIKIIILIIK